MIFRCRFYRSFLTIVIIIIIIVSSSIRSSSISIIIIIIIIIVSSSIRSSSSSSSSSTTTTTTTTTTNTTTYNNNNNNNNNTNATTSNTTTNNNNNNNHNSQKGSIKAAPKDHISVYFDETGRCDQTPVYWLSDLNTYTEPIQGPAIIMQDITTIVIEPMCTARIGYFGDIIVKINNSVKKTISKEVDPIYLSVFSHRYVYYLGRL